MRDLDLQTLRLFAAVCEQRSIARVAEQESIVGSAISKRLAQLEDTVGTALSPQLGANQSVVINGAITAVQGVNLDVDLVRGDLQAGDRLSVNMVNAANLYTNLRIFNAAGVLQVAKSPYFSPGAANTVLDWVAPSAGTYYLGVSGYNNASYSITAPNSGNNGSYQGTYTLSLQRLVANATTLAGIDASAASGTPANAGVASANTGQTIVLSVAGGAGAVQAARWVSAAPSLAHTPPSCVCSLRSAAACSAHRCAWRLKPILSS